MNNEQWHISLGLFLCAGVVAVFAAANAILKLKAETTLVEFHDLTIASASDYYDKCQRFNESCHFDEDYKQLQEKFLYKNTPISPEIIKKFMSNQSYDYKNNIVSIDVASCWKTNRFSRKKYDYILLENNQFQCGLVRHAGQEDLGIYKWIGRLDNGLHVVRFVEDPEDYNYGGYLLFFKISQAEAFTPDGDTYKRMLLTLVRNYSLGYGNYYDIKISGNKIFLKPIQIRNRDGSLRTGDLSGFEDIVEFKN